MVHIASRVATDPSDHLESALVRLLLAEEEAVDRPIETRHKDGFSSTIEYSTNHIIKGSVLPREAVYCGIPGQDTGRLFAASASYLLHGVEETLGEFAEVAIDFEKDSLRWTAIRRMKSLPRGFASTARCTHYYEVHFREIGAGGEKRYVKSIQGWNSARQASVPVVATMFGRGGQLVNGGSHPAQLIGIASTIEDYKRAGAWRVELVADRGIKLATDAVGVRELFAMREGPRASGGRRSPLLHWVRAHSRRSCQTDRSCLVPKHMRGVTEFEMDGFGVRIIDPEK